MLPEKGAGMETPLLIFNYQTQRQLLEQTVEMCT